MGTPAQLVWQPSTARVVVVDGFGPFPRGSWQAFPTPLCWPAKDPGDTLDYVVDFAAALTGDLGDVIATLDVAVTPGAAGDLLVQSSRADGTRAILWFSSGAANTIYAITVVVGTNSGRVLSRTIGLPVRRLSTPSPFGNDITDEHSVPLDDEMGGALTIS